MTKLIISVLTSVFLCVVSNVLDISYAQSQTITPGLQQKMKNHAEKKKIKNPMKYKEMVERAKGNITYCTDCHVEVAERSKFPSKGKIERIQPMRK